MTLKTIDLRPNPRPTKRRRKKTAKRTRRAARSSSSKRFVIELVDTRGDTPVFLYWSGTEVTKYYAHARRYIEKDAKSAARVLAKSIFKTKRFSAVRVVPA